MPDVWDFGEPHDDTTNYRDGTVVPHRSFAVYLNGEEVGEVECHMHKRKGRDGVTDVSFGITPVVYGPIPRGGE